MTELKIAGSEKILKLIPQEIGIVESVACVARDTQGVGCKDLRLIHNNISYIKSFISKPEIPESATEEEKKAIQEKHKTTEIEIKMTDLQYLFFREKLLKYNHYMPESEVAREALTKLFDKFNI